MSEDRNTDTPLFDPLSSRVSCVTPSRTPTSQTEMRLRMTQQRVAEKIAELSTKFQVPFFFLIVSYFLVQDYGTYNLTRRCSDLERALQQQRNLTSEKEAEITQLREELQASHEHCQALQNKLQQCVDSCEALLISTLTDQSAKRSIARFFTPSP